MKKTTRKEIIEEFDENGKIKSRTTIEETEEESATYPNINSPDTTPYSPLPSRWWEQVTCTGTPRDSISSSGSSTCTITCRNDYDSTSTASTDPDQITIEQFFRGE